jgi:nucleotide-binding universal stress UspA family protein
MKNILVPTDFSNNAFKALAYAAVLAKHCGATVKCHSNEQYAGSLE